MFGKLRLKGPMWPYSERVYLAESVLLVAATKKTWTLSSEIDEDF